MRHSKDDILTTYGPWGVQVCSGGGKILIAQTSVNMDNFK